MLPHPLTNFEISKCHQKEPKLNGVYSRNNFPKKQDGAYVINFDELESLGTYWIALYVNGDIRVHFMMPPTLTLFEISTFQKK